MLKFAPWVILSLLIVAMGVAAIRQLGEPMDQRMPAYSGSMTCVSCHENAALAWKGSHHDWAWRTPTSESVLGDFSDSSFTHAGIASRFTARDDHFFVETEGPDGDQSEFEIKGTVGVSPLQQYLVETEPGRLQNLDTVWDTERNRWFHLYPDQTLAADDGLHWSGPYKSWNARCAECHATAFQKNYEPLSSSYTSTQAEKGVTCEACHGPGEAHLSWANDRASFAEAGWYGINGIGLSVTFDPRNTEKEIQLCAGCHSRREPIGADSPAPGTPFANSYRLALLRNGLYHPDGQIQDEVYVYGSFPNLKCMRVAWVVRIAMRPILQG